MGELKEVIPVAMGLVLAFLVARVFTSRTRAFVIVGASIVLGYLATKINHESLAHVLFDAPQVAFACFVGLLLLGRYLPTWVKNDSGNVTG